jgi:hypothetical protein
MGGSISRNAPLRLAEAGAEPSVNDFQLLRGRAETLDSLHLTGEQLGAPLDGQKLQRGRDLHRVVIDDGVQHPPKLVQLRVVAGAREPLAEREEAADEGPASRRDGPQVLVAPYRGEDVLRLVLKDERLGGDAVEEPGEVGGWVGLYVEKLHPRARARRRPVEQAHAASLGEPRGNLDARWLILRSAQAAEARGSDIISARIPLVGRTLWRPCQAGTNQQEASAGMSARKASVSMKDVAALAGVSLGTVSNVLNSPGLVAESTRRRVEQAIAALGWIRNESARQLQAGRSRSIGMVGLDIANPFFTDLVLGAEESVYEHGCHVQVSNSAQDSDREMRNYSCWRSTGCAGC